MVTAPPWIHNGALPSYCYSQTIIAWLERWLFRPSRYRCWEMFSNDYTLLHTRLMYHSSQFVFKIFVKSNICYSVVFCSKCSITKSICYIQYRIQTYPLNGISIPISLKYISIYRSLVIIFKWLRICSLRFIATFTRLADC